MVFASCHTLDIPPRTAHTHAELSAISVANFAVSNHQSLFTHTASTTLSIDSAASISASNMSHAISTIHAHILSGAATAQARILGTAHKSSNAIFLKSHNICFHVLGENHDIFHSAFSFVYSSSVSASLPNADLATLPTFCINGETLFLSNSCFNMF